MPTWASVIGILGIGLTLATMVLALLLVFYDFPPFGPHLGRRKRFSSGEHWHNVGQAAPWVNREKSSISQAPDTGFPFSAGVVRFHTIRCFAEFTGSARWGLQVEFVVKNDLVKEIVIDDMHARIFEKNAFAPPLATISYYGDIRLSQDNSILKDRQSYSLMPDKGYQIILHLEASRFEAAPAYGRQPAEQQGRAVVVFGLLVDYYIDTGRELDRKVLPSDCIYLFECPDTSTAKLRAIDKGALRHLQAQSALSKQREKFIGRLDGYLNEHLDFEARPRR